MSSTKSGGSNARGPNSRRARPPMITVAEWRAALELAMTQSTTGGGVTTRELAESLKCSEATARQYIRKAIAARLVEPAAHRRAPTIDGKSTWVPTYRLKRREPRKAAP